MKNIRLLFLLNMSVILVFSNFFSVQAEPPTRPKIVFTSTRDGNGEIYMMNADGSEEVQLTDHPGDDFDPVWSPTGRPTGVAR
jgi:Tol biopolymer transport system component